MKIRALHRALDARLNVLAPALVPVSWTKGVSGAWLTKGAWSGGKTPNKTNAVTIGAAGTYTVTVAKAATAGNLLLNDTTATLAVNSRLSIGDYAAIENGTISVSGHGVLAAAGLVEIGYGGNGLLAVSGGGSLSAAMGLQIGETAGNTGTFTATAGAKVSSAGSYQILGNIAGASGIGTIDGTHTSWDFSGRLKIGDYGNGTLTISDNATVTGGNLSCGELPGSTGTLTVESGATLTTVGPYDVIGNFATSVGSVTVEGAGSEWDSQSRIFLGYSGSGALTVTQDATLIATGGFDLGAASGGTGTLSIMAGAKASTTFASNVIADASGTTATVLVDGVGSSFTMPDLGLGTFGDGSLTVSDAGHVTVGNLFLGYDSGGSGVLAITTGGTLTTSVFGGVGETAGASGSVTIDGAGSVWNATGLVAVADSGSGTLAMTNGGSLNATGGVTVGNYAGSSGLLTVNSGATVNAGQSASILVGNSGHGTLNVGSGGGVTTGILAVGAYGGAAGLVDVTGAGSSLSAAAGVAVGYLGTGTLDVNAGASVTISGGFGLGIGYGADGSGGVVVDGSGTSLSITGGLSLGAGGTGSSGTLTVSNGATVTVATASSASAAAGSAIVLAGGTLNVPGGDTIAVGATLGGYGTVGGALNNEGFTKASGGALAFLGSVTNNGTMTAATSSLLSVAGGVGGTGLEQIGAAGSLSLLAGAGAGQTIDFLAGTGLLDLTNPLLFAGVIDGFAGSDKIDLVNTAESSFNFAGGVLTVTAGGATVASLAFGGHYTNASFGFGSDGNGGTFITFK